MYNTSVYILRIEWIKGTHSPWVGPIVGLTKARTLATLVRRRLRTNDQKFEAVKIAELKVPEWLFNLDALQDPVDKLLASVFAASSDYIDSVQ